MEAHIYANTQQLGYFFLMILMYCSASLPLMYVYSFNPKSALIGFINFFIINVIACFLDMVMAFMALFSQGQLTTVTRLTRLTTITNDIRWVISVIFPSVNFKRALFNIRLKSNSECTSALNSILLTNYTIDEPWPSLREPGLGLQILIFSLQTIVCWLLLILIEQRHSIKLRWRHWCGCDNQLEETHNEKSLDPKMGTLATSWNDSVGHRTISLCHICSLLF